MVVFIIYSSLALVLLHFDCELSLFVVSKELQCVISLQPNINCSHYQSIRQKYYLYSDLSNIFQVTVYPPPPKKNPSLSHSRSGGRVTAPIVSRKLIMRHGSVESM